MATGIFLSLVKHVKLRCIHMWQPMIDLQDVWMRGNSWMVGDHNNLWMEKMELSKKGLGVISNSFSLFNKHQVPPCVRDQPKLPLRP